MSRRHARYPCRSTGGLGFHDDESLSDIGALHDTQQNGNAGDADDETKADGLAGNGRFAS